MYIRNNTIAVVFRVVFLIVCGAGLVMKLLYSRFSIDTIMSDFALISNVLALIYFAYLIIARPGYERGMLRGAVTIYMLVTFIVYYFIHFGVDADPLQNLSLAGYLLYFAAPLMAVLDYLLFCRKGWFTSYSPLIWTILPVVFNLAIFIINRIGIYIASIPYFNLLGLNMIVTLFVFLGVSYLLFAADNLMAGRRR
ncbi:MAG: hypothetical protein IKM63_01695 [Firmicutes bacterium]|nr:hypothetical protein [Bacillota bacterium]MBR6798761.1 hypothetical protein [Bacillota bacterium]